MNSQQIAELERKNKAGQMTQAETQALIEYARLLHEAAADRLAWDYGQAWGIEMQGKDKRDKK